MKGCEVANDFAKEKLSYSDDALPQWLAKVDKQFGVTGSELKGVCVEQMTGGRGRCLVDKAVFQRNRVVSQERSQK